jgi:hypothetical protein
LNWRKGFFPNELKFGMAEAFAILPSNGEAKWLKKH